MCNLLLKAVPAWGQTRWLRALSSQVLKASKNGNFTALLAGCSTAWASSWGKQFSLHSVWISLVQFMSAVSDSSTNFSKESGSAFQSLYCYRAFSSQMKSLYWSLLNFLLLLLASQPVKMPLIGRSALKLQTDSTWKLVSPEKLTKACSIPSSRSLAKVINRTGPSRCWSTALVMSMSVPGINELNYPVLRILCPSVEFSVHPECTAPHYTEDCLGDWWKPCWSQGKWQAGSSPTHKCCWFITGGNQVRQACFLNLCWLLLTTFSSLCPQMCPRKKSYAMHRQWKIHISLEMAIQHQLCQREPSPSWAGPTSSYSSTMKCDGALPSGNQAWK